MSLLNQSFKKSSEIEGCKRGPKSGQILCESLVIRGCLEVPCNLILSPFGPGLIIMALLYERVPLSKGRPLFSKIVTFLYGKAPLGKGARFLPVPVRECASSYYYFMSLSARISIFLLQSWMHPFKIIAFLSETQLLRNFSFLWKCSLQFYCFPSLEMHCFAKYSFSL